MYLSSKTLVTVLKTDRLGKDRRTGRLIQARGNSASDQSRTVRCQKLDFAKNSLMSWMLVAKEELNASKTGM